MRDVDHPSAMPTFLSSNPDPEEARLEARELPKYLLAKSYFEKVTGRPSLIWHP